MAQQMGEVEMAYGIHEHIRVDEWFSMSIDTPGMSSFLRLVAMLHTRVAWIYRKRLYFSAEDTLVKLFSRKRVCQC